MGLYLLLKWHEKQILNTILLKINLFSKLFWNAEDLLREVLIDLHYTQVLHLSTSHQIKQLFN